MQPTDDKTLRNQRESVAYWMGEAIAWKVAWETDHQWHVVWSGDRYPARNRKYQEKFNDGGGI